ncbi:chitinase C-terminal domain-containing protein [Spirilliplanes yamanashiensis]|uniref:Chitinase n=1 Tax=Spirilliplanes yamanashiensis TaxID=42233 RepID=A0A8J3YA99_9ACTN|nr:glycosyl hydrolase family 18 protein [Spirilliplanes yamanashiensis]MDP9816065.1 chitinase [Spirilliplanes yamanashiensis]GIJ04325.1 chitinase [Spirilliplanes yamanashiensis]
MNKRTTLSLSAAAVVAAALVAIPFTASAETEQPDCRPDGLAATAGVATPYCLAYDTDGREKLGADHGRRIIGYFTGWRTGANGQAKYLASNIPWDKVTHINYAFAHVDAQNKVSVGADNATNPATGMSFPGVPGAELDPSLPYKGHFNLLTKYKKQHPDVKTLISVGGWAETGGYLDGENRVASGGFYTMTTNSDGSVNQAGIDTFATSAVDFIRKYGFNGVDIDYEYPTSMKDAGHPDDFAISNARRAGLNRSYNALMKTLRDKLNAASAQDGKYYMLTVAAPSSGYLLRGMENFASLQYLDYVNIMSYDLHGAWNEYVGPNASLFDDGKDAELAQAGVYTAAQFGGIGYLNTDWAAKYFRGAMAAGRINIGVPYYTRGHRNVTGGTNGLWGKARSTGTCPKGTTACGDGAVGIDNIWHDVENGKEVGAGSGPLWHAKNLEKGIAGSYLGEYNLSASNLTGTYTRHYNSTLVAPWLWNDSKKVFLSTEDEQSLGAKADYVVNQGLGGVMIWELAGDYDFYADRNGGKGEYYIGDTLTTLLYDKFKSASKPGALKATQAMPADILDVKVDLVEYALGDSNYPINPKMRITNKSTTTIPGGAEFQFDYPVAAPANMSDQSGSGLKIIRSDHTGNNVGGLKGTFHRASFTIPGWQSIAPGGTIDITVVYQLPIGGPSNYTVTFGGKSYALSTDNPRGAGGGVVPTSPTASVSTSTSASASASPSPSTGTCAAAAWDRTKVYTGTNLVSYGGRTWKAQWWTQGDQPGTNAVWLDQGACAGEPSPSVSVSVSPSASVTPSTPTTCSGPAWDRGKVYTGASGEVTHKGHRWTARWWTQGDEPGTNEVWRDLGAC